MKKFGLILFLLVSFFSNGQSLKKKLIQPTLDLQANAQLEDSIFKQHLLLAKQRNIKLIDTLGEGKILHFNRFTKEGEPLYLTTFSTTTAGKNIRANSLYSGGELGLNLKGFSNAVKNKLAMWDGGGVNANHVELEGRVTNFDNSSVSEHSSHVAGIMIATGINKDVHGMANAANIKAYNYTNDISEISSNAKNLDGTPKYLISNHSYGYQAGWVYDANGGKWRWYGNTSISKTEDYKFGQYDNTAASLDRIAFNAPYLLMVKSAGNNRDSNGPADGEAYFLGGGSTTSTEARSKNDSYDIISTTGNAKNILTVGAADMNFVFPFLPSNIGISSYSSWGPTDDGRIKPDIVGIGTNLLSIGTGKNDYTMLSGTSMSSPNVAGGLLLLQEHYTSLKNDYLLGATLKGLALHTSLDILEKGPDYQSGWGLLDLKEAALAIQNNGTKSLISEEVLNENETKSRQVIASGDGPLTASISWYDPAGPEQGSVLDPLDKRLVNDLDIRIRDEDGNTYFPFILDPAKPANQATTGDNFLDNYEKIIVPNTIPGKTYTVNYSHKDSLKNNKQNVSLIITGIGGKSYCLPNFTTQTNQIDSLFIEGEKNPQFNIALENGGKDSLTIFLNNSNSKNILIVADLNGDGDFTDENEKIVDLKNLSEKTIGSSIQLPKNLILDENTIIKGRILLSNSAINNPCGTFNSGESRDITFKILRSSNDIEVYDIQQSGGEFCPTDGATNFYAKIRNRGSKVNNNFKLKLSIFQGATLIKTIETDSNSLNQGVENEISFNTEIKLDNGLNYTYKVEVLDDKDQNLANNVFQKIQTLKNSADPITKGFTCVGTNEFVLKSLDDRIISWYDNSVLIGIGNTLNAYNLKNPQAFVGNINFDLGPKTKKDFGGGSYYENFGPAPVFNVSSPIILESARIYTGNAGKIYFDVFNLETGELISSILKDVPKTRISNDTARVNNQIPDDPNDQGVVVNLNLNFPAPGKYILFQTTSEGASIYRSNIPKGGTGTLPTGGNIGYPFTKDQVIELQGAFYNGGIIQTGYYYFYDMKFVSAGCKSNSVSVPLSNSTPPTVSINPNGIKTVCGGETGDSLRIVSISDSASTLWFINDIATDNTSDSIFAKTEGVYKVVAKNQDGCSQSSETYTLNISRPNPPKLSLANGYVVAEYGSSFQWYQDGFPIDGATEKSFLVTESGDYYVVITNELGCIAKSSSYEIKILATEEKDFKIYPNPSKDFIKIQVPSELAKVGYTYKLFDLTGRVIKEHPGLQFEPEFELNISDIPKGIYFVLIPEIARNKVLKFIKE